MLVRRQIQLAYCYTFVRCGSGCMPTGSIPSYKSRQREGEYHTLCRVCEQMRMSSLSTSGWTRRPSTSSWTKFGAGSFFSLEMDPLRDDFKIT